MAIFTTALLIGGALGLGKGLFANKEAQTTASAIREQSEFQARERERQSSELKSFQKVSFLKSGVNLAGSPLKILEETTSFAKEDIRQIFESGNTRAGNVSRAGNAAIFQGLTEGLMAGFKFGG